MFLIRSVVDGVVENQNQLRPLGLTQHRALPTKGVAMVGRNTLVNFTSAMSKSGKFRSERRDGSYFWWFKGELLPPGWNEAPDLLEGQPGASSVHSGQEGGEGDSPATI